MTAVARQLVEADARRVEQEVCQSGIPYDVTTFDDIDKLPVKDAKPGTTQEIDVAPA